MLIERVYFMDKTCINCRHFRRGSVGPTKPEHVWGDCLKAEKHAWVTGDTEKSLNFTWADAGCEDFEANQRLRMANRRILDRDVPSKNTAYEKRHGSTKK